MPGQYRIRAAALADIEEIAEFIRRDNPVRAASFADELVRKIETIAERPLTFPANHDLSEEIRSARHGMYRIFFELVQGEPHILRVLHGARDIPNLFRDS